MQIINDTITRIRLAYRLVRDERVPLTTKMIPLIVVIYIVSPLDLIPFFPIDDLAILLGGLRVFEALVPDYILYEHRAALGVEIEAG
jgi:uncharacterized membrane protein YkvA (DUF1232 family)